MFLAYRILIQIPIIEKKLTALSNRKYRCFMDTYALEANMAELFLIY